MITELKWITESIAFCCIKRRVLFIGVKFTQRNDSNLTFS